MKDNRFAIAREYVTFAMYFIGYLLCMMCCLVCTALIANDSMKTNALLKCMECDGYLFSLIMKLVNEHCVWMFLFASCCVCITIHSTKKVSQKYYNQITAGITIIYMIIDILMMSYEKGFDGFVLGKAMFHWTLGLIIILVLGLNKVKRVSKWLNYAYDKVAIILSKGNRVFYYSAFVILIITLIKAAFFDEKPIEEYIDFTVVSAVLIEALLAIAAVSLRGFFLNRSEDYSKLTNDYSSLNEKYKQEKSLVVYKNDASKEDVFPVVHVEWIYPKKIIIDDDPYLEYQLPDEVINHYSELFNAHSTSTIYNNVNIRVVSWNMEEDGFHIKTGRTTYYNSLVTNRSMDNEIGAGLSVRNLFEPGPFLKPLQYSRLSNHLGFNGFVMDAKGYICFVFRKGDVSIGKRTYGDSIGASLKSKYSLNGYELNEAGLEMGIVREIYDELAISQSDLKVIDGKCSYKVICAYRDLLEGGKPQLLIYAESNLDKRDIETQFKDKLKEKLIKLEKKDKGSIKEMLEKSMAEDGEQLEWIHIDDLKNAKITADGMSVVKLHDNETKTKFFNMVPSASASVVMFLDFLNGKTDKYVRGVK